MKSQLSRVWGRTQNYSTVTITTKTNYNNLRNLVECHLIGQINNEQSLGLSSVEAAIENYWTEFKAQTRVVDYLNFISGRQ